MRNKFLGKYSLKALGGFSVSADKTGEKNLQLKLAKVVLGKEYML